MIPEKIVFLQNISAKSSSVAEIIIRILASEWPLTTKELHLRINAREKEASFQAIHKAAKLLVECEVLIKSGQKYAINVKWLNEIMSFGDAVRKKYDSPPLVESAGSTPIYSEFTGSLKCN